MWLLMLSPSALGANRDVPATYPTIAAAVSAASDGDVIRIDPVGGTYTESVTVSDDLTFEGFNGRPLWRPSLLPNGVILVDNGAVVTVRGLEVDGTSAGRALRLADGELTVEDLVVHDTLTTGTSGAAILVEAVPANVLTIRDSFFDRSQTTGGGHRGAFVSVIAGDLVIERTRFADGSSGVEGGCVAMAGSGDLSVVDSTFLRCTATTRGGAIWATHSGLLSIVGSRFEDNLSSSDRGGGAMYLEGPSPIEVTDSWFLRNRANGSEGGGAIYHRSQAGTYLRDVFCENTTAQKGGAIRVHGGNARVAASVFEGNTAGADGGAVWTGVSVTVSHVSLHGNDGSVGDAIAGAAVITDTAVIGHPAGAFALDGSGNGSITVATSGFWDNPGGDWDTQTTDLGGNLSVDPLTGDPSGCDVAALVPPPLSPHLGAGSLGSDIGAFSGTDTWPDGDADGVLSVIDCDDGDASMGVLGVEVPADGLDGDCDGTELCYQDADGDGFGEAVLVSSPDTDCNGPGEATAPDDVCPLGDDAVDPDADGVPSACDPCPDDLLDDSDGDGVCDSLDRCPDHNDAIDADGDGQPDDCDPCPQDPYDDSDGDGVCDGDDLCAGGDDRIDTDGDGIPNACDDCGLADSDGDGNGDDCDLCPDFDDRIDTDGDGIPDGCDTPDETGTGPTDTGSGPTDTSTPPSGDGVPRPAGPLITGDAPAGCGCAGAGAARGSWLVLGLLVGLSAASRRR